MTFKLSDMAKLPQWKQTPLRRLVAATLPKLAREQALPLRLQRSSRALGEERSGFVAAKQASDALSVDLSILRLGAEEVGAIVARGSYSYSPILYDLEKVRPSVDAYKGALRIANVGRALGSPDFAIAALSDAGLIDCVTDRGAIAMAGGGALFSKKSVDGFIRRLNDLPVEECHDGTSLFSGLAARTLEAGTWAAIWSVVLSGELPIADRAEGVRADKLIVSASGLGCELAKVKPAPLPKDTFVSAKSGGKLLGVQHMILVRAIHAGLLPATTYEGDRWEIPLAALGRFAATYMWHSEVIARLGVHTMSTEKATERVGVRPAAVLNGRHPLWPRKKMEAALQRSRI